MLNKQVLNFDSKNKDATKWKAKVDTSDPDAPVIHIHKKCTHHGDIGELDIDMTLGSDPTGKIDEGYVIIKTNGIVKLSILEASDLSIALSEASRMILAVKGHEDGPDSDGGIRYE